MKSFSGIRGILILICVLILLPGHSLAIGESELNDTADLIRDINNQTYRFDNSSGMPGNVSLNGNNNSYISEVSSAVFSDTDMPDCEILSIITVGSSGCDYTSITAAINNATDGDTILVMSGSYPETIVIDKSLTIRGNDTGGGIPVMSYQESSSSPVVIDSRSVTFENFRILSTGDSAIDVRGNNTIVRNITATEQKPDDSTTPVINIAENLSYVTVSDCRIETDGGYGIKFENGNDISINNNNIVLTIVSTPRRLSDNVAYEKNRAK